MGLALVLALEFIIQFGIVSSNESPRRAVEPATKGGLVITAEVIAIENITESPDREGARDHPF